MTSSAVCSICNDELVVTVDESDGEDEPITNNAAQASHEDTTVPDDVALLNCGCHFHWECLVDAYSDAARCPTCAKDMVSSRAGGKPRILCSIHNEGGLQNEVDIMSILAEEAYLKTRQQERRPRAFLEFCRNGDLPAIIEMLGDSSDDAMEDEEEEASPGIDLVRYQDSIGERQSGLHAAVQGKSREVAWFLLLLASELDLSRFPAAVFQEAAHFGVMRPEGSRGQTDIRGLVDARGRTAEALAAEIGPPWNDWLGQGLLAV